MSNTIENMEVHLKDERSPGEDFYSYVNQEWLDDPNNSIPDDYSSWGGFTKLYDDSLNNQINMVKTITTNTSVNLNTEEEKIAAIWNASSDRFNKWSKNESDCSDNCEPRVWYAISS